MVVTKGSKSANWSQSLKSNLSSNCRLQLAYMKLESLVIVN